MKQAKIKVDIIVEIKDAVEKPGGGRRVPIRIYTNYKNTLKDFIKEARDRHSKGFDTLLDTYVNLCLLEIAAVPFTPLTTAEALKLKDCEIEEVEDETEKGG